MARKSWIEKRKDLLREKKFLEYLIVCFEYGIDPPEFEWKPLIKNGKCTGGTYYLRKGFNSPCDLTVQEWRDHIEETLVRDKEARKRDAATS